MKGFIFLFFEIFNFAAIHFNSYFHSKISFQFISNHFYFISKIFICLNFVLIFYFSILKSDE